MAHAHASHDSHGDHHGAAETSNVPPSSPVAIFMAVAIGAGLTAIMLWALLA